MCEKVSQETSRLNPLHAMINPIQKFRKGFNFYWIFIEFYKKNIQFLHNFYIISKKYSKNVQFPHRNFRSAVKCISALLSALIYYDDLSEYHYINCYMECTFWYK